MEFSLCNTIIGMMTCSGTIVFGSYVITYPILRKCSLEGQFFVLKMAVFFYLVPVSELKYFLWDIIEYFPLLSEYIVPYMERERPFIEKLNVVIKFEDGVIKVSSDLKWVFFIMACVGLMALTLLIMKFMRYRKLKNTFLYCSDEFSGGDWEEQYSKLKAELKINSDVKIRGCRYNSESFVVGFLSPVIIFPIEAVDKNSRKYIMKHELIHVKHKDLITRLLSILVIVVHWFNPVAYLLFYELIVVSEMICDRDVLKGTSDSERRTYSELILQLATVQGEPCVVRLADKVSIKRRILEMKKVRKRNFLVSGTVAVVIGLVTSMSALALYNPSRVIEKGSNYNPDTTVEFVNSKEVYNPEMDNLPYDYFFTSEDGVIIPLSKDAPERVLCFHTKTETGGLTEHEKNNRTGSCTVTVYDVVRCSKCDKILEKTQIEKHTYKVCPH